MHVIRTHALHPSVVRKVFRFKFYTSRCSTDTICMYLYIYIMFIFPLILSEQKIIVIVYKQRDGRDAKTVKTASPNGHAYVYTGEFDGLIYGQPSPSAPSSKRDRSSFSIAKLQTPPVGSANYPLPARIKNAKEVADGDGGSGGGGRDPTTTRQ